MTTPTTKFPHGGCRPLGLLKKPFQVATATSLILGLYKKYSQDATLNLIRVELTAASITNHLFRTSYPVNPAKHGRLRQHQHPEYQREFVTTPTSYNELCQALALPEAKWCRSPLLLYYPNTAQSQSRDTQPRTRSRTIPELAGSTPVYATSGGQYALITCQV